MISVQYRTLSIRSVWVLLMIVILGSGCVSKNKYESKVNEAERFRKRAVDLLKQNQELEARVIILEQQLANLAIEKDLLKVRIDSTVQETVTRIQRLHAIHEELVKNLQNEIRNGEVTVTELRNRLSVNIVDQILFLSGETEVRPKGQEVLGRVGSVLSQVSRQRIQIAGHTDNVPIGEKLQHRYATNWELSAARATTVARLLIEKYDVNPRLVFTAGYAEYKPIASNDTKAGRRKNRRIEIVLVPPEAGAAIPLPGR